MGIYSRVVGGVGVVGSHVSIGVIVSVLVWVRVISHNSMYSPS